MAKKTYIVIHDGITLPDYSRNQIKKGVAVDLDQKTGDAYCKRGFLMDAKKAAKTDSSDSLRDENRELKARIDKLEAENKVLKVNPAK